METPENPLLIARAARVFMDLVALCESQPEKAGLVLTALETMLSVAADVPPRDPPRPTH